MGATIKHGTGVDRRPQRRPFLPTDIASLLHWWDADDADTIVESGGLVSSWTDKVGGIVLSQSTEALKPSITARSSRPGGKLVMFNGDVLESATGQSWPTKCHCFYVAELDHGSTIPANQGLVSWGITAGWTLRGGYKFEAAGPSKWRGELGGVGYVNPASLRQYSQTPPNIGADGPHVISWTTDPNDTAQGKAHTYLDGGSGYDTDGDFDPDNPFAGFYTDEGTWGAFWQLRFGRDISDAYAPGPMSQFAVFSDILTGADRANMFQFANLKLGR